MVIVTVVIFYRYVFIELWAYIVITLNLQRGLNQKRKHREINIHVNQDSNEKVIVICHVRLSPICLKCTMISNHMWLHYVECVYRFDVNTCRLGWQFLFNTPANASVASKSNIVSKFCSRCNPWGLFLPTLLPKTAKIQVFAPITRCKLTVFYTPQSLSLAVNQLLAS